MKLKCSAICTKVNKKSSSPAFMNLAVNDRIDFSIDIEAVGVGRGGSHAAYIRCVNPQTNLVSKLSFNQIGRVLDNFEFKEID